MVLTDLNAGIFQMKIELGNYFGMEKEELYIQLREPTTAEAVLLNKKDANGNPNEQSIFDIIPKVIIDHNFMFKPNEDKPEKKMSSADVWKEISRRSAAATDVVEAWSTNIPLANRKPEKSETLPDIA